MKAVIVPAWGQKAASNFYPWLQTSLESRGVSVRVLDAAPTEIGGHLDALSTLCPEGPDANTIYIGHSVGCKGSKGAKIGGLVCVAGWMLIEPSTTSPNRPAGLQVRYPPWDKLEPWANIPTDYEKVRSIVGENCYVLLSNDDPFTIDQKLNGKLWEERLHAKVTLVEGQKHFNGSEYPQILDSVTKLLH